MSSDDGSMMGDRSRLDLPSLDRSVAGTRFAGQVRHFPSVLSTNSLALEAAQAGERSGVWVAEEQTAGRGRGGHTWHSAAGDGLYVSAMVRRCRVHGCARACGFLWRQELAVRVGDR